MTTERVYVDPVAALVAIRRQRMTQQQVADAMGVGQSTVSEFEAGDHDPRLSTVRRYAATLATTTPTANVVA